MKTLPDNSHLDHLRRQAKDLLAGLRDTDPDATLADAQASLAEQYGFRTWTDLKAEVDRRQGRADAAAPGLAEQIATRFGLGSVRGEMRSVARPDEVGRRWLLETDRGRWTPRTVDDVYPPTDGEENARFQEAAAHAGVPLPHPVRSTAGAVIEEIEGNRWRVYESPRSGPPLAAPVSADITREVGVLLARVHGLRFPANSICPWNAVRLTTLTWPDLAARATAKRAPWAPVLVAALPTLADLKSLGNSAGLTSPPILCHNNFNPGNVRVGPGRGVDPGPGSARRPARGWPQARLIVTGWEHAAGLPAEWELAATLTSWAVTLDGGVTSPGVCALLDGYRSEAGALPPLTLATFRGTAIALQNYVADQLDLALNPSTDEDARYADRNVRHLLTHLPTRATFDQLLKAASTFS